MPRVVSGGLDAGRFRFAIVCARWNELVTARLLDAAVGTLTRHGAAADDLLCVHVPGSFELPLAAQHLARTGRFQAIVCLGCILRGETPHFDHLAADVTHALSSIARETGVPMAFGVVMADTMEQALDRSGGKHGNKGAEAALAAIDMAHVLAAATA